MQIISHRGYWKTASEKNSGIAFARSFDLGFGTETDVRDLDGQLVISHDPPTSQAMGFEAFLSIHASRDLPLALNIKADGLAAALKSAAVRAGLSNYFVFDMSIPDMLQYKRENVPFYTRLSEYEPAPAFLESASGVWLDSFESTWFDAGTIQALLRKGTRVCVVSSELHKRPHQPLWDLLLPLRHEPQLMLCTDLPEEAQHHFRTPE
jgi:glycerophosphoryl diester phosphodiesterase